jgi:hypothetical protein
MPHSSDEGKREIVGWVRDRELNISNILDVEWKKNI